MGQRGPAQSVRQRTGRQVGSQAEGEVLEGRKERKTAWD